MDFQQYPWQPATHTHAHTQHTYTNRIHSTHMCTHTHKHNMCTQHTHMRKHARTHNTHLHTTHIQHKYTTHTYTTHMCMHTTHTCVHATCTRAQHAHTPHTHTQLTRTRAHTHSFGPVPPEAFAEHSASVRQLSPLTQTLLSHQNKISKWLSCHISFLFFPQ